MAYGAVWRNITSDSVEARSIFIVIAYEYIYSKVFDLLCFV